MARPALSGIGIGAVLIIGLSSCGSVDPGQGPGLIKSDTTQESTATASPAIAEDGAEAGNPATTEAPAPAAQETDPGKHPAQSGSPAAVSPAIPPSSSVPPPTRSSAPPPAPSPAPSPSPAPAPAPAPAPGEASPPALEGGPVGGIGLSQGAVFTTYTDSAMAITYDTDLVPAGSTINLVRQHGVDSTSMSVEVTGLLPNHGYAAHVHLDTCGETGDDAGPSYRNDPTLDPAPGMVNTENEIWLELATGPRGTAQASTTVTWPIRAGEGYSLIFHAAPQNSGGIEVNERGARVACFVLVRV